VDRDTERVSEAVRAAPSETADSGSTARLSNLLRAVNRTLVEATTREEIEAGVCEAVTSLDPYVFAWIGERKLAGANVTPRTWAGVEEGYLDEIVVSVNEDETGRGPAGMTLKTGRDQVVQDIEDESTFEPWRESARERGYRSIVGIPVEYGETSYGALFVYAARAHAFLKQDVATLAEVGEVIGFGINAVSNRNLLLSDTVVELELSLRDSSAFFNDATRRLGCRLELEGAVPIGNGCLLIYISMEDGDVGELLESGEETPHVEHGRIVDRDEPLLEFEVSSRSPTVTITNHGGTVRSAISENGTGRLLVEVAPETDVRTLVEEFCREFPDSELLSKRDVEHPVQTAHEFRQGLADRLTIRQRSVLRTAYHAGYYDWPRQSTAEDIATVMDVSSPTLHYHLRNAQREVLDAFFDQSSKR